jgi:hypothetical protein
MSQNQRYFEGAYISTIQRATNKYPMFVWRPPSLKDSTQSRKMKFRVRNPEI